MTTPEALVALYKKLAGKEMSPEAIKKQAAALKDALFLASLSWTAR